MQRSYLKWAGGKYNALPNILPVINSFNCDTLVEPFFGSGTVSLNTNHSDYIVSDLNDDLVCTHNEVSNNHDQLLSVVSELFERGVSDYYELRDKFNSIPKDGSQSTLRAAIFIYLNKHGFNGLCRYNKSGGFNVPSAEKTKKPSVPVTELRNFSNKGINPVHMDFESMFSMVDDKDDCLIYCDPPYVPMGESDFNYTSGGFKFDSQIKLKELALRSRHVALISNHYNDLTKELYSDADQLITFDVRRTISSKSSGRIPVVECLAVYDRR